MKISTDLLFRKYRSELILAGMILLALIVRLFFFHGFGLGDDPAYFQRGLKFDIIPDGLREFRPGFEWPTAIFFRLFGVSSVLP
jgi:hypothetical protein